MGAGASVQRSASSMKAELERLRERELNTKEENVKQSISQEAQKDAEIVQLQSERNLLAHELAEVKRSLSHQREGWRREKDKTMALTYSSLPLSLINEDIDSFERRANSSMTKRFPMVTIAQSDVVGFSSLTARLKPQETIRIIDHLHALMDEAYHHQEIFIVDRSSDGCTAVSGLVETVLDEQKFGSESSLFTTDSSYGSEFDLMDSGNKRNTHSIERSAYERKMNNEFSNQSNTTRFHHPASHYSQILAISVLKLMSVSSKINIPLEGQKQLQLRVALHTGPCSAGVLGLQTGLGITSSRIPQFKLLGPTVRHANSLCRTGLALQIRVSKKCKELLSYDKNFMFERCPDFMALAHRKPIESYWLIGKTDLAVRLPSLELAVPLSEYENTDI